jgi:protein SCO1/2
VKEALRDDAGDVSFVFVSVDGARDTPEVLSNYLGQFDAGFIGMTGDEAILRQMGAEYGLLFQQETISVNHEHEEGYEHEHVEALDSENYFVEHTSPSFLIDRDGYLRLVYFYGTDTDVIAEGIRQVLHQ